MPPPSPTHPPARPRRSNVAMLARRGTELMDVLLERQAQLTGVGAGQAYVRLMSRLEDVLLVGHLSHLSHLFGPGNSPQVFCPKTFP